MGILRSNSRTEGKATTLNTRHDYSKDESNKDKPPAVKAEVVLEPKLFLLNEEFKKSGLSYCVSWEDLEPYDALKPRKDHFPDIDLDSYFRRRYSNNISSLTKPQIYRAQHFMISFSAKQKTERKLKGLTDLHVFFQVLEQSKYATMEYTFYIEQSLLEQDNSKNILHKLVSMTGSVINVCLEDIDFLGSDINKVFSGVDISALYLRNFNYPKYTKKHMRDDSSLVTGASSLFEIGNHKTRMNSFFFYSCLSTSLQNLVSLSLRATFAESWISIYLVQSLKKNHVWNLETLNLYHFDEYPLFLFSTSLLHCTSEHTITDSLNLIERKRTWNKTAMSASVQTLCQISCFKSLKEARFIPSKLQRQIF
eukprot:snap_masked-scaffold_38-processed-gene-1.24-mRNA-1 protein AED:1.00 eAED:1.00 QI:0/0/0/0/1/1/2/0/365